MPYADKDRQREYIRTAKKRKYSEDPTYAETIRDRQRAYRAKNPEHVKEQKHQYYLRNAAKISAQRKANRGPRYEYELRNKYGLSKEGYEELLQRAGGKCEVCGATEKLAVDHCHDSLVVRGILCKHCNTGLGYFRDREDLLAKAVTYLLACRERLASANHPS